MNITVILGLIVLFLLLGLIYFGIPALLDGWGETPLWQIREKNNKQR